MNIRTLVLASLVFATGSHLSQAAKRIDPWYAKGTNFAKSILQSDLLSFPYEQKIMHDISPLKEMIMNGTSQSKVFKLLQSYAKGIADTIQKVNIDTFLREKNLVADYRPVIATAKTTIVQVCNLVIHAKNADEAQAKFETWRYNLARKPMNSIGR